MINMNIELKNVKKKHMDHHMDHQMELNLLQHYEYKRMYPVEVKHQYETLRNEETEQGSDLEVVERTWQTLKTSTEQAAHKVLPKEDRVKRKFWMTNEILQKGQERKKREGTEKYKEIDNAIWHMCTEEKEAWWNEKCKEIEELEQKHKTKEMHAKVKEIVNQETL